MQKNWEKTMKKIGRKRMKKNEKKNNAKKKILKMDSEERIHLKPISEKEFRENRQRLWNQISEQDSQQGVEGDARISSVE